MEIMSGLGKKQRLKVLTLNLNTGHGPFKSFFHEMTREEVKENLDKTVKLIRELDPDVIALQEVDIKWRGTANINQASYIADRLGFYVAFAIMHRKIKTVPNFLKKHSLISSLADRETGLAIISKYPIINYGFYRFGNSRNNFLDLCLNLLNETKGYMWADIEKDNVIYTIINVHLINDIIGTIKGFLTGRFFYKGGYLREKQISTLIRHLEEVFKKRNIIVAGDFNSVPPGFEQRFTDRFHGIEEEDDYKGDNTMSILMRYCEKTKTLLWPFKEKNRDEIPKFNTYPSLEPKRPLDYIFFPFNNSYNVIKALVSDHLPVMCEGVKE